jgi:hypothetical protein
MSEMVIKDKEEQARLWLYHKIDDLEKELADLRAQNADAKKALEEALAVIYSWAIDGHAHWCESQCTGDHCTCGHLGAKEIPQPEGE